jgi:hypothetical protein
MPFLLFRRRNFSRLTLFLAIAIIFRVLYFGRTAGQPRPLSVFNTSRSHQIPEHGFFERASGRATTEKSLDVKKYSFLQSRIGRGLDEPQEQDRDPLSHWVREGAWEFWERFVRPL